MQETNRGVVALYAEVHDQSERLRQEEERMRVLLDSVHDYAICMLATDGEIVSWNSGAARVFGYSQRRDCRPELLLLLCRRRA